MDLADILDRFDKKLHVHLPPNEAGIREVLAQSLREAQDGPPGDVEVEASFGRKRHDVLVHSERTAFEVKFHRDGIGGSNRPLTMQYGQLLADVRKLASNTELSRRVLLLLTDRAGLTHLKNKAVLPGAWGAERSLTTARVMSLARSASGPATTEGPWIDTSARLVWQAHYFGAQVYGLAWELQPLPPAKDLNDRSSETRFSGR